MSRKKFQIDMPDDTPAEEPVQVSKKRGPMASAIAENAEALQVRKEAAQAIRDENDALAHEFVALREAGHVVEEVALDTVHTHLLVRDRMLNQEDEELESLVTSIRETGLSNPIRVLPRAEGVGYELVQGYRRLSAFRELHEETGADQWSRIPALIMPSNDVGGLYRRMVDENVIRKDLSFAEMAHAASTYAADPRTDASDLSAAVAALFQSAPYSKRSYIRSFAFLLEQVGQYLKFPAEIPRALGVALARELKERPAIREQIKEEFDGWDMRGVADELAVLKRFTVEDEMGVPVVKAAPKSEGQGARTKTTFHIKSAAGQVKCTAAQGRLEIKVDRDFSAIDRAKLEKAIASLVDGLV